PPPPLPPTLLPYTTLFRSITAHDTQFYELLPRLFPHADAKAWFVGNEAFANDTAYKNGTLQVAYFLMALRALGLDTGPMTGFDKDRKSTRLNSSHLVISYA